MVSLPQISKGLINFIEQELIVHGNNKQKFLMYFLMPQIPHKLEQLFNQYKENIIISDFIKAEGIDLNSLYKVAKEAINKTGSLELFGIILNEQDMDKLHNYILNAVA